MTSPPPVPSLLLAEDEEHVADLLLFMLEREGYQLHLARDGRQAQELLETLEPPQLAVLDIMMPYVDGFALLEQIRSKPGWQGVPVIMLTSKSQERHIIRALDAGANDYMVKPFQPFELIARIKRLLRPAQ